MNKHIQRLFTWIDEELAMDSNEDEFDLGYNQALYNVLAFIESLTEEKE